MPRRGELEIEFYGELAVLINLANGHPRSKGALQSTLVAGTRSHLYRTRLHYERQSRK